MTRAPVLRGDQDWEQVVLRRSRPAREPGRGPAESEGAARARKVDSSTAALPMLDPESRRALVAARVAAGLTQARLAQAARVPVAVVQALEAGGRPVEGAPGALPRLRAALPGVRLRLAPPPASDPGP